MKTGFFNSTDTGDDPDQADDFANAKWKAHGGMAGAVSRLTSGAAGAEPRNANFGAGATSHVDTSTEKANPSLAKGYASSTSRIPGWDDDELPAF